MVVNVLLSVAGEGFDDPILYRSIVGVLQYIILTRSNLSFIINKCYQFMSALKVSDWYVVKGISCYLKSISTHGLVLKSSSQLLVQGFADKELILMI